MANKPKNESPQVPELLALTDRAQKGDKTALPALRDFFEKSAYVEQAGNLARFAQDTLIEKFTGQNLLMKEGITRKLASLRLELAGENPSALERLLVDRIGACWLHLHHLETIYAEKGSMTLPLGDYYQRCINSAHKRYLSAIKTLATIRKLAVPVLQVNIAKKQVNVAGSAVVAEVAREQSEQSGHTNSLP